jgi:hypothetical protein
MRSLAALAAMSLAGAASAGGVPPAAPSLPKSALAVWRDGAWRQWWRSDRAPAQWTGADDVLAGALSWRRVTSGAEWAQVRLAGPGEAWRLRLIVVRLDPARVQLALDTAFTAGRERASWSIDAVPPDVLVAVNAGQFPRVMPWGWVVLGGREFLAPGGGPLSTGIAFDSSGGVQWIPGDSLPGHPARRTARYALQSYPTLVTGGGVIPAALHGAGGGVDVEHRDARLAIGQTRDGHLLIALTRFDAVGGALDFVPFGLTTPEMAAVMGALGARDAVMLDGGISSQMLIRDATGTHRWTGMRRVPLALVVRAR